ncbi:aminotransferase class III-fold pyridoxal phosphate-dependent enzyme [Psychroserpens sp. SPM9]|uniref:aminotransferase class III-fold pyridoxal phosphate-dependent enzyme n=1 Tax=Psychroserpens sp. SPM9 TaxID=2975598 RepID=UPI0021A5AEE0|nr:aminotransferase class III-fold pyridoxal phosphate-dependent enzyme [Psychroserpens sp. SPM9]MDG5491797.1 aminotransferase class III-fold pyridoxal phosphate-dependent enzyme [Psychroserpens sp. SPM9]
MDNTIIKDNLDYTLFSWSKQGGLNPINASHAKGSYVYDSDGKKYLDFSSQLMNVNIGHGNQRITNAVVKQMQAVSYVYPGMATEVRGQLGKKIAEITPGNLSKTFFTLGGAEAIENAIKLARMYTGRHKIITHYRAYHGATYGAMSAGGDPRRFPVDSQAMPNVVHVENPYAYRCPWHSNSVEECGERALEHLERVIKFENPDSVAAILFEGESGSSGCLKYPPMYLKRVRELCDTYGIMMIDDEVMSGFGRTGKMFGIDHHEVTPDIMCLAKGLTSGYLPLGGVVVTDKIAAHFNDNPMVIGLTYSAHPTLCAAALENIKIIEEENLVERAAEMGLYIEEEVEKLKAKHPSIGDFRNTGLLGCIELVKNRFTKEPTTPWNAKPNEMEATLKMAAKIRELGMFTFVRWNWIFIAPPLNITKEEVDEGLKIIAQAISIADEYCK